MLSLLFCNLYNYMQFCLIFYSLTNIILQSYHSNNICKNSHMNISKYFKQCKRCTKPLFILYLYYRTIVHEYLISNRHGTTTWISQKKESITFTLWYRSSVYRKCSHAFSLALELRSDLPALYSGSFQTLKEKHWYYGFKEKLQKNCTLFITLYNIQYKIR